MTPLKKSCSPTGLKGSLKHLLSSAWKLKIVECFEFCSEIRVPICRGRPDPNVCLCAYRVYVGCILVFRCIPGPGAVCSQPSLVSHGMVELLKFCASAPTLLQRGLCALGGVSAVIMLTMMIPVLRRDASWLMNCWIAVSNYQQLL